MSCEANEAVIRPFYEELWNEWRLVAAAEIVAGCSSRRATMDLISSVRASTLL